MSLVKDITTNIHVNRMTKWLEGNTRKYLEAEAEQLEEDTHCVNPWDLFLGHHKF
jgi:hypothetical protein